MDTVDIYRSAKILIEQYAFGALNEAIRRAAELKVKGDDAGSDVWLAISKAIMLIDADYPPHGESTH